MFSSACSLNNGLLEMDGGFELFDRFFIDRLANKSINSGCVYLFDAETEGFNHFSEKKNYYSILICLISVKICVDLS